MNVYVQNKAFWEDSINSRRSVRSYIRRGMESPVMEKLHEFRRELIVPFEHTVECRFFKSEEGHQLANNLRNPPEDCIAFIADTDVLSVASVGFIGELFLLYANALGISTCWFGHYITAQVNRLLPDVADASAPKHGYGPRENIGRRVICISPLGYWNSEGLRPIDRMTARLFSFNRKPIGGKLIGGLKPEELDPHLLYALDLAMKAPSAANTQHWQFDISHDQKSITIALPLGYKHIKWEHPGVCVGACAAHFWLGLQIQGIECTLSRELSEGRVLWKFEL